MKNRVKKVVVVVLAVLLCINLFGCSCEGETVFRSGKVIETIGNAVITRDGKEIPVYAQLVIKSGDKISTGEGSRVDLLLDDDKYLVIRENTVVTFELEGNAKKGAIKINLEIGAVHHTVENPLSREDSYEIHTAEAVTAIRGTELETTREESENGGTTYVEVTSGTVNVDPVNPEEEDRDISTGESAVVVQNEAEPPHFIDETEKILCPCCSESVSSTDMHLLSCSDMHYSCDSGSHEKLLCGHYACTEGLHEIIPCEHYACSEGEHEKLICGHFACTEGEHGELKCGHYECSEGEHGRLACGHYACRKGKHVKLSCGNYDCADGHDKMTCGHCECDTENYHDKFECGHYACDLRDLMHEMLGCGNYACLGGGHEPCYFCYDCTCTGTHGDGVCNI